jgi:hypothetical protein
MRIFIPFLLLLYIIMKTVVSYAYYETNRTMYNLDFFAQVAIVDVPNMLFIIVVNGHKCSIELPNYDNCIVIKRDNVGFDFGAHRESIDYLLNLYNCVNVNDIPYDNFIFINCGVIGPFLPTYYPSNMSWTNIFTSKLNDKVKLVGTSLVCFEYTASPGKGPHIEGFCFCLDKIGLDIVMGVETVFINHKTKQNAVNDGEYGLSKAIINAGYSLDCLLYKYQEVDWTNKENWVNQNNYTHPSRVNTYDTITIHPFEVVFHKWFWANNLPVNFNYIVRYRKWKLDTLNKNKQLHATFGVGEYMINVTNIIKNNFINDNKIIIPVGYHNNEELQKIAKSLGSTMSNLNITIKGTQYQILYTITEPVEIYIENPYNITAKYGIMDFNTDVTHKFINTFINNNKITIPRKYDFNKLFGDCCPKKTKHIFLKINGKEYMINENNYSNIEFEY